MDPVGAPAVECSLATERALSPTSSETRQRAKTPYTTCWGRVIAGEFPQVDMRILEGTIEAHKAKQRDAYKAGHSHIFVDRLAKRIRWVNQIGLGRTHADQSRPRCYAQDLDQDLDPNRITGKRPVRGP